MMRKKKSNPIGWAPSTNDYLSDILATLESIESLLERMANKTEEKSE